MITHYTALALIKLGRPEFAGFLFGVAVSGGLARQETIPNSYHLIVLLTIALLTNLWGFIHNDICDIEIDRTSKALSNRPLVCGSVSIRAAWGIVVICILSTFACVVLTTRAPWATAILFFSVVLGFQYNVWSKRLPGSDILFAASTALIALLGASLVAGGSVEINRSWAMVWTVMSIQFFDYLIFNAGATLKDVKNDRAQSAITMATFFGVYVRENDALSIPRRFQVYIVTLRAVSIAILFVSPVWTGILFNPIQHMLLIFVALASLFLTVRSVNLTSFDRNAIGNRWVQQDATGKLLIPLLLFPLAGFWGCILLIVVPFLWFLVVNALLYSQGATLNSGF